MDRPVKVLAAQPGLNQPSVCVSLLFLSPAPSSPLSSDWPFEACQRLGKALYQV